MSDIGSIAAAGVNVAGTLAVTGVAANMINKSAKGFSGQSKKVNSHKVYSPKTKKSSPGTIFKMNKSKKSKFY